MTAIVCLWANSLTFPERAGHLWEYLNWALGLKALGCRVIWAESIDADTPADMTCRLIGMLRSKLEPYGLARDLAIVEERFSAEKVTASMLERSLS